jgi:two-component sensor histidine kinase
MRLLRFEWIEQGGPPVTKPARPGFGSTILTNLTPRALGGSATLDFDASGLRWTLTAPMDFATRMEALV